MTALTFFAGLLLIAVSFTTLIPDLGPGLLVFGLGLIFYAMVTGSKLGKP